MDLKKEIKDLCLKKGEVILASGKKSDYYFDCKKALLKSDIINKITERFFRDFIMIEFDALGGVGIGGGLMVSSALFYSSLIGRKLKYGSIVRKETKDHGTQQLIENPQPKDSKIVILEDVITSGGSVDYGCEKFKELGNEIVGIFCIINRETGGVEMLREKYKVPVEYMYRERDFIF